MWTSKSLIKNLAILLLAGLVLAACGNPIGKTKRGRQHRKPGGSGGQVEQPDNGSQDSGSESGPVEGNNGDGEVHDGSGSEHGASGSVDVSYDGQSVAQLLSAMPDSHPRLITSDARMAELNKQRKGDKLLNKLIRDSINKANKYLKAKPIKYQSSGPAMLRMAHEALKRSYALGFAWRATKDQKYLKKLEENLVNVAGFRDWAPDHFLATAEFSHAVGIGYDWAYNDLSESSRKKIRAGLIKNGLNPGMRDMKKQPPVNWVKTSFNWNLVCNGGLIIGSLAIAEDEPQIAEEIIEFARHNMVKAYNTYSPDGAWPEGPGYWAYATQYAVYTLAALQTTIGTDFGLSKTKGLSDTGFFAVALTSQTGNLAAFSDVEGGASRKGIPSLFWLADFYNHPELATEEITYIQQGPSAIQHVLWYPKSDVIRGNRPKAPMDAFFEGEVELMFMRGGYEADDVFVPFKAGFNKVNHAHLDVGNFEFEAFGIRWARDLGSDNYSLPGYWESRPDGRRWDYFRIGSFSHNVLTFGGEQQAHATTSKFVDKGMGVKDPFGVIEYFDAYPKTVSKMKRGVKLLDDRKSMLVQDEYTLSRGTDVTWGISTDASITLEGSQARLKQNGKEVIVKILEPSGAKFYKEAAPTESRAKSNKGVSRLEFKVDQKSGTHRIAVQFLPVWPSGPADTTRVKSLSSW